jgi:hypothetical protein
LVGWLVNFKPYVYELTHVTFNNKPNL